MSDAGAAVLAALKHFEVEQKLCIFHIKQNIKKHVKKCEAKMEFVRYFDFMSRVYNKTIFDKLMHKMSTFTAGNFSQTVQNYINSEILNNYKWSKINFPFAPTTNNALEAVNKHIKCKLHTKQKPNFASGIPGLFDYIKDLSKKNFATKLIYTQKDKTFNSDFKTETFFDDSSVKFVKIFTRNNGLVCLEDTFEIYKKGLFHSLSHAIEVFESVIFVEYPKKINKIQDIICTCYSFSETYKCPHVFSVLEKEKLTCLIDHCVQVTKHKKRGRKPFNELVYLNK